MLWIIVVLMILRSLNVFVLPYGSEGQAPSGGEELLTMVLTLSAIISGPAGMGNRMDALLHAVSAGEEYLSDRFPDRDLTTLRVHNRTRQIGGVVSRRRQHRSKGPTATRATGTWVGAVFYNARPMVAWSRRHFLMIPLLAACASAPEEPRLQPNVVLFVSDTHRWGAMSFTQTPQVHTPNMELLRDQGVSLDRHLRESAHVHPVPGTPDDWPVAISARIDGQPHVACPACRHA